jgi:prophage regulatory protein
VAVAVIVLLSFADLRNRGIKFTRQHIHRLIRNRKFPAPIKVGDNTNAWIETEVDQYFEDCIAARDAIQQQPKTTKARTA